MAGINIENIVASTKVCDLLDIELLAEKMPGSSYNPDEFAGLTIKFDDPRVAVLVLSTGKIVCTGAKNMDEVDSSIKKVVKKIKDVGFEVKKKYDITTENIVASTEFNKEMHLSSISKGLLFKHVEYEPEQFPGLIYKADDFNALLILFSSGKLICTGAKNVEDATKAIDMMKEKLSSLGVL
jgi:transcription initiation factor TFIID TATA-box-binding protein